MEWEDERAESISMVQQTESQKCLSSLDKSHNGIYS